MNLYLSFTLILVNKKVRIDTQQWYPTWCFWTLCDIQMYFLAPTSFLPNCLFFSLSVPNKAPVLPFLYFFGEGSASEEPKEAFPMQQLPSSWIMLGLETPDISWNLLLFWAITLAWWPFCEWSYSSYDNHFMLVSTTCSQNSCSVHKFSKVLLHNSCCEDYWTKYLI